MGLASPVDHGRVRALTRHLETQRELMLGEWQYAQRDIEHQAERAERTRHGAKQIVAGDILHHPAAVLHDAAAAIDDAHAEHEIARRTGVRTAWAGQAAADGAADGAPSEPRWLKAQVLSLRRQLLLKVVERRAGAHGDHQVDRIIVDDAAVFERGQRPRLAGTPVESLAAAPLRQQRSFLLQRSLYRGLQGLAAVIGRRT